jgi:hypothetical protein
MQSNPITSATMTATKVGRDPFIGDTSPRPVDAPRQP